MLKKIKELALFRFTLIAPVINKQGLGEIGQLEYFRKITAAEHRVPGRDKPVKYRPETLKKWLYKYRKYGFEGLATGQRKDRGTFRSIDGHLEVDIKRVAERYKFRTAKTLYKYLVSLSIIDPDKCCYATFNTYAKRCKLLEGGTSGKKRKSFEKQFINMMWVGDIMYGPHVHAGKRKVRTYLTAFIDDHARFIVGACFAYEQDSNAVESVLKKALLTYGIPGSLYLDNGKVFVTENLVTAGAHLGFKVVHSKPGDAASRGKIERFYRTVRDQFLDFLFATLDGQKLTLEKLNTDFAKWLHEYLHRKHSTTGESPYDRYMNGVRLITVRKEDPEMIERAFRHEMTRTVSSDSLVPIDKIDYEVPGEFIGKKITLFFNPAKKYEYYLWSDTEKEYIKIKPVDRYGNAEFPINKKK